MQIEARIYTELIPLRFLRIHSDVKAMLILLNGSKHILSQKEGMFSQPATKQFLTEIYVPKSRFQVEK